MKKLSLFRTIEVGQTVKRRNPLLPLAVLAVLCWNAPLRAGEQVPFKGEFSFTILSTTPLDATHVRFDVDVTGRTTLLGNFRGPASFTLDVDTAPLGYFTYVGAATWVSANGDAISLQFAGRLVPTTTPGLFNNEEIMEIVGGTGRFQGATGAAVVGGQYDPSAGPTVGPNPFEGTISSPGSLKQ